MKRPRIHVIIEICQIGILGDRLVEWFPPHADAKHFHKGGFSNADIACNCNELFHLLSMRIYSGISPASSLSMICWKTFKGCAPTMASPLIKNVGVELIPKLIAKSLSA